MKTIYVGIANEDGEFIVWSKNVYNEDDRGYYTNLSYYSKSQLDTIIDVREDHEKSIEEYTYVSFDKDKVEDFVNEKRKYFINRAKENFKKAEEELKKFENSKITTLENES